MSSSPPTPLAQPGTVADIATPNSSKQHLSWGQRLRDLNPLVKVAFVALLVVIGVAWYMFSGRVTTDDAQVDCHITAVAPQVPGYVVKLFINDNTPVKESEVLILIDPRTYEAEVAQARAALDVAEAQANSAKLQIGLTRGDHYKQHEWCKCPERIRCGRPTQVPRRNLNSPQPPTCNLRKPMLPPSAQPMNARRAIWLATLHCFPPATFRNFNTMPLMQRARGSKERTQRGRATAVRRKTGEWISREQIRDLPRQESRARSLNFWKPRRESNKFL